MQLLIAAADAATSPAGVDDEDDAENNRATNPAPIQNVLRESVTFSPPFSLSNTVVKAGAVVRVA